MVMLESRQEVQFGYYLDFYKPNSFSNVLKRGKSELAYLFLPEDTTYMEGDSQKRVAGLLPSALRDTAKVLFWTGISIAVPLLLSWLAS